jgi:hypothetical protein
MFNEDSFSGDAVKVPVVLTCPVLDFVGITASRK